MAKYRIDGIVYDAATSDEAYAMADAGTVAPIPDDAMGENIQSHGIQRQKPMMRESLENLPGSLYREYVEPLSKLHKLPEAVGGLLRGSYHKLAGNNDEPSTQFADAMFGSITKPYQSAEALENEMRNNPARLIDDASLALPAIGAPLKAIRGFGRALDLADSGVVRKTAEAAGKVGDVAVSAGNMIEPVSGALKLVDMAKHRRRFAGDAAKEFDKFVVKASKDPNMTIGQFENGVENLRYKTDPALIKQVEEVTSAAKFPTKLPVSEKDMLSRTIIKYDVPLNRQGINRRDELLDGLGRDLKHHIDDSVAKGETIPLVALKGEINKLKSQLGKFGRSTKKDLALFDKMKKEFFEYWAKEGKTQINMQDLQNMKHAEYERIKWNDSMKSTTYVKNQIRKAFARSAKKQMDKMRPQIIDINTKYGELAELKPYHEKATSRISQNLDVGLLDSIQGGTAMASGAYVGHQVGNAVGAPSGVGGIAGGLIGAAFGFKGAANKNATKKGIAQISKSKKVREGIAAAIMRDHPVTWTASHGMRRPLLEEENQ